MQIVECSTTSFIHTEFEGYISVFTYMFLYFLYLHIFTSGFRPTGLNKLVTMKQQ